MRRGVFKKFISVLYIQIYATIFKLLILQLTMTEITKPEIVQVFEVKAPIFILYLYFT